MQCHAGLKLTANTSPFGHSVYLVHHNYFSNPSSIPWHVSASCLMPFSPAIILILYNVEMSWPKICCLSKLSPKVGFGRKFASVKWGFNPAAQQTSPVLPGPGGSAYPCPLNWVWHCAAASEMQAEVRRLTSRQTLRTQWAVHTYTGHTAFPLRQVSAFERVAPPPA